jgi:DNA-binding NarL/FixJ family response regulator
MRLLDSDIHKTKAYVIDGNAGSRASLVAMLKAAGVGSVEQATRLVDARRTLEARRFDIVLCEHHFPGETGNGQDMLADLRLAQLLPLDSVVVMVSGESAYSQVAEAAEAALDAYLLKPHTEQALHQRLADARQRKRQLKPVLDHVAAGRFAEAAELCDGLVATRSPVWVHAARIGAELRTRLGQPHAAMKLLDAVMSTKALPWARMGIARAQYKAGSLMQARRTLESLLSDQPGYADAFDVMGRVMLEQGDNTGALDTLRRASELTPGSVARLQKFGVLAFYHGNAEEAADALQRATQVGLSSKVYDLQGLVLLAALQYDRGDRRGLALSNATLLRLQRDLPDSARVGGFAEVAQVLQLLATRQVPDAVNRVRLMLAQVAEPAFDFEAACNLLIVVARMYADETHLGDIGHSMQCLARRFAVSKATCDMLVSAARHLPELAEPLRAGYAHVCGIAESAVSRSVAGARREAVVELLGHAETTLNAKLLDLAEHTLHRHGAAVADAAALQDRITSQRETYHAYGTQIKLTRPGGNAA